MAKGNLFLGMGRGSIGDVTFYRGNGQQLSRVRNRKPKNPRSAPQLYQRAIMATVVKAYQAGKAIFDHSFQGYAVGEQNQRQFLSLNVKKLRSTVANDINTPIAVRDQLGRVVAPGTNTPVGNAYIISRGSYPQEIFVWNEGQQAFTTPMPQQVPNPESPGQTVNESARVYMSRVGLIPGDIYTFVLFAEKDTFAYSSQQYDDALAWLNYADFAWIRLIVKSLDDDTAASPLDDFSTVFDIEFSGAFEQAATQLSVATFGDTSISMAYLMPDVGAFEHYTRTGAIGVIRSRRDQDLRSDSDMILIPGDGAENMFGIASSYLLDTWQAGSESIGDSELILEGGDL